MESFFDLFDFGLKHGDHGWLWNAVQMLGIIHLIVILKGTLQARSCWKPDK